MLSAGESNGPHGTAPVYFNYVHSACFLYYFVPRLGANIEKDLHALSTSTGGISSQSYSGGIIGLEERIHLPDLLYQLTSPFSFTCSLVCGLGVFDRTVGWAAAATLLVNYLS